MNNKIFTTVFVIGAIVVSTGALLAADIKPFTIDGVNYTKWLWGTSRADGSLYNFTTIPAEGYGENGQGTELELLVWPDHPAKSRSAAA